MLSVSLPVISKLLVAKSYKWILNCLVGGVVSPNSVLLKGQLLPLAKQTKQHKEKTELISLITLFKVIASSEP